MVVKHELMRKRLQSIFFGRCRHSGEVKKLFNMKNYLNPIELKIFAQVARNNFFTFPLCLLTNWKNSSNSWTRKWTEERIFCDERESDFQKYFETFFINRNGFLKIDFLLFSQKTAKMSGPWEMNLRLR